MYFLLKMGIFQPAMLVYQRVQVDQTAPKWFDASLDLCAADPFKRAAAVMVMAKALRRIAAWKAVGFLTPRRKTPTVGWNGNSNCYLVLPGKLLFGSLGRTFTSEFRKSTGHRRTSEISKTNHENLWLQMGVSKNRGKTSQNGWCLMEISINSVFFSDTGTHEVWIAGLWYWNMFLFYRFTW